MALPEQRTSPDGGSGPAPNNTVDAGADLIIAPATYNDRSPLRQTLDTAIAEANGSKLSMNDLTVLSPQIDPFRLDTPANHKLGKWLADTAATLGLGDRRIHNRGLHYMILGQPKPDGSTYVSNAASWDLLERASKYARWLGYIPFDQITDQRNAPPVVRIYEEPDPHPFINVGIDIELPDDIRPKLGVEDFRGTQPYKIVLVGEKSSLDAELGPIAEEYGCDLYLPTGCISDTMIFQMAKIGDEDGRPMIVLYFADADPSGHNMGIEVGRKLHALQVLHFPALEFEVHRAALTVDQVRRFGLPSTPLKDTEKRANAWTAATGLEQTEIDALATLRPELLREVARDAIAPFYDFDLDQRVREARQDWINRAIEVINDNLDTEQLARIRAEATEKLDAMREQIAEFNEQLQIDVDDFDLPDIEIPEARLTLGLAPQPLLDSSWSFIEQCKALIDSKAYRNGGGS
jgi:hypothetical protein